MTRSQKSIHPPSMHGTLSGAGLCDSVGDTAVDKMGLWLVDVIEYNVQDTAGVGNSVGPFETHGVRAKLSAEKPTEGAYRESLPSREACLCKGLEAMKYLELWEGGRLIQAETSMQRGGACGPDIWKHL